MSLPRSAAAATTHGGTNAAVALVLGAYLAIVLYQGNLGKLAAQAKTDFLGGTDANGNKVPAFWRWFVALLILLWLAGNPKLNQVFGPLLIFALVAMLINVATNNPAMFANLNKGVATLFGRGGS